MRAMITRAVLDLDFLNPFGAGFIYTSLAGAVLRDYRSA